MTGLRQQKQIYPESVSPLIQANQWDDSRLVGRALMGDAFAENAIYRRYAPFLLNLAARLLKRMNDADDVLQETFVIAFRKLSSLHDPNALKSWLTKILVSQVQKALRVRRFKSIFRIDSGMDDATLASLGLYEASAHVRAELREIDEALAKVPSDWRMTWMLHRIEGMSISETAFAVRRSTATVKRYVTAVDTVIRPERRTS